MAAGQEISPEAEPGGLPLALFGLLALTAAIAILFSWCHLLWSDEFGILITDSVRGVLHLVQVQRTSPVCLDPMAYHLLAHACILLFGPNAFAIRLPPLIGYLTMQVCLFLFVRRCAGRPAGLLAVALSTFSGPLLYASLGRPYGLLLGFSGLVAVCWQTAVRRSSHRTAPLLLLAFSLALALNTHYYAVLLLIPLYAAEAVRTLNARRIDLPVVLAIFAGTAGLLLVLPFLKGAAAYDQHYYLRSSFNLHFISHSTLWLLVGDPAVSPRLARVGETFLALSFVAALAVNRGRTSSIRLSLPAPELTLLALLAVLPFFGLVLGTYVTHAVETRFVMPALFGLLALMAIALSRLLPGAALQRTMLIACLSVAVLLGWQRIRTSHQESAAAMATMKLPVGTLAALAARPGLPVFLQNVNLFQMLRYYAPDSAARDRLALFYSLPQDLIHLQTDTMAITARNLKSMSDFHIQTYEDLQAQPGEHLFVVYHSPIDWAEPVFTAAQARIEYLGPAYGGDLISVRFH